MFLPIPPKPQIAPKAKELPPPTHATSHPTLPPAWAVRHCVTVVKNSSPAPIYRPPPPRPPPAPPLARTGWGANGNGVAFRFLPLQMTLPLTPSSSLLFYHCLMSIAIIFDQQMPSLCSRSAALFFYLGRDSLEMRPAMERSKNGQPLPL